MFFKRNAPTIVDYDKTKSELLRLGWLTEIYNAESNKSIYDITDLGYQYYFAICMKAGRDQMFTGPPIPGVLAIKQQMMAPICITDMIMNSFIPFALLFLRTGIPAKLAMPTKKTAAVTAKYMDAS